MVTVVLVTSDWDVRDDGQEDESESSDQGSHDCRACMYNTCFAAVQAVPGRSHRVRVG